MPIIVVPEESENNFIKLKLDLMHMGSIRGVLPNDFNFNNK